MNQEEYRDEIERRDNIITGYQHLYNEALIERKQLQDRCDELSAKLDMAIDLLDERQKGLLLFQFAIDKGNKCG
jgi:hypothetical protein